MALRYKMDVLAALKEKGITTYQIRKEKLLSESTVQKLRAGIGVSWENIETLCDLLDCQPADLMEYVKEQPEGTLQYILQISVAGERQVVVSEVRLICATDDANVQSQKHYVNAEVYWTMTDLIIGFLL